MTTKITELPSISSTSLLASASTPVLPVVSTVSGNLTTSQTSLANIKSYISTGSLNLTAGFVANSNSIINGSLYIVGDLTYTGSSFGVLPTTVTSTGNFVDTQTDANLTYPVSDNGRDVGSRFFYYKSGAGNAAALVWKNTNGRLTWYDSGAGNTASILSGSAGLGVMQVGGLIVSNSTVTTANATGALQVGGGISTGGNLWVVGDLTGQGVSTLANIQATLLNVTGNITANSFIGIGTSTPLTPLHMVSPLPGVGQPTLQIENSGTNVNGTGRIRFLRSGQHTGGLASGHVGIIQFDDTDQASTTFSSYIRGLTTSTSAGAGAMQLQYSALTAHQWLVNGGTVMTYSSGNLNITNGNINLTGNLNTTGNIIPSANATYNIGSSSYQYNTVYSVASEAVYGDLAERYAADGDYEPGTVVIFGGEKEITVTANRADYRVAGVISTDPAYLMSSTSEGLPVALRGKVPVKVVGKVCKGDLLVTSTTPGFAESGTNAMFGSPNSVFAKSLVDDDGYHPRNIWAVIL